MAESFLARIEPQKPIRQTPTAPAKTTDKTTPYGKAVLDDKCQAMRNTVEGTRNETLRDIGRLLGGFVGGGEISWNDAHDQLRDAAEASGLDYDEVEQIPRHLEYGMKEPLAAPEKPQNDAVVFSIGDRVKASQDSSEAAERPPVEPIGLGQFKSRLLSRSDLRELPDPSPLIGDTLDRGTTALLFGKWGSAKSFIALDWACSVASGRQWQGRYTERAKVLYIAAEGAFGIDKRVDAWEMAWKTKISDEWMRFLPVPANLMTEQADWIAEMVSEGGYEFIIFDTLARCTVGAEENSAKDTGVAIDAMSRIRDATPGHRGVVLCVHHAGKDGQTLRGSSAYEAGVDTVYFVEKDMMNMSLRCTKRKDGPDNDRLSLRLEPIPAADSCVVNGYTGKSSAPDDAAEKLKGIFRTMFPTGVGNADLRAVAAEQGMSQSALHSGRSRLITEGWLVNSGTNSRPHWEMARKEDLF